MLCLPILLALINPNWIFNPHITDDYIYLGYQMEMPRYTDWFPAANRYFGERVSWIAPTYSIRQLFSPMLANFIIHFGVYYVALFSIYGAIHRLTNRHIAVVVALLMGHYPPFMRAVGWDYVDGFILACMSLCLFFITYACYSPRRWRLYLAGGGMACMLFVTSNIFYACYIPALMIFFIWLNHHNHRHAIIQAILWVALGMGLIYVLEGIYYASITGNWLTFTHSLTFSQEKFGDDQFQTINNHNFLKIIPTWHIFPVLVLVMAGIALLHQPQDHRPKLGAGASLLGGAYGVLLLWEALGHRFLQYLFYSSVIIPMAFILLGILIENHVWSQHRQRVVYGAFFIPAILFALFSIAPQLFITNYLWVLVIIALILFGIGFRLRGAWGLISLIGGFTILGTIIGLTTFRQGFMRENIVTYIPNRYEYQSMYDGATQMAQVINQKFDTLDVETFRLWYANDPKMVTFHAIASIYLRGGGRVLDENDLPLNESLIWNRNTRYIPNNTLILFSSQHTPQALFEMAENALMRYGYKPFWQETIWIDDGTGGFHAVFITTP
jgi:hypothetical protein